MDIYKLQVLIYSYKYWFIMTKKKKKMMMNKKQQSGFVEFLLYES